MLPALASAGTISRTAANRIIKARIFFMVNPFHIFPAAINSPHPMPVIHPHRRVICRRSRPRGRRCHPQTLECAGKCTHLYYDKLSTITDDYFRNSCCIRKLLPAGGLMSRSIFSDHPLPRIGISAGINAVAGAQQNRPSVSPMGGK